MNSTKIAYFVGTYPALTETFIQREIDYLDSHGVEVHVFSLRRAQEVPNNTKRSSKSLSAIYGRPDFLIWGILAQISLIFRNPAGYLRCIRLILHQINEHPISELAKQFGYLNAAAAFVYILKRRQIPHIHAHFATATSMALFCHYLCGVTFSFTAHASADIYYEPVMLPEKMDAASAIIAISEYNKRYLNLLSEDKYTDKIYVVYNGVEIGPPVSPIRQKERPFHIVSIAGLRIFKGYQTLLDALSLIRDAGFEFRCTIVGDGPKRKQLEGQAIRLSLQNHIQFLGALEYEDAQNVLAEADVFVLASEIANSGIRDGIPTVCIEAMAQRIPVISTYVSGIPELIEDGKSGMLVPERNPRNLAEALTRILLDEELRAKLAVGGYNQVYNHFNVNLTMAQLFNLIQPFLI